MKIQLSLAIIALALTFCAAAVADEFEAMHTRIEERLKVAEARASIPARNIVALRKRLNLVVKQHQHSNCSDRACLQKLTAELQRIDSELRPTERRAIAAKWFGIF